MNFSKRLLSIAVAIFVVVSCMFATPGISKNVYAQSGNKEAIKSIIQDYYRENVQHIFKNYGIFDEKASEKSGNLDNKLSGLLEAKTVDITGDGYDELFLMYLEKGDIHMEILTFKSGDIIKDWEAVTMWGGIFNMDFCKDKATGDYYWYYGVSRGIPSELFTYKNGKYQKVSTTDIDYPEPTKTLGNCYDEGEFYLEHMKKHLGLTQKIDHNELIFGYIGDIVLSPADSYALATAWELINNKSKSTAKTTSADALGSIKYYGDKSKCKMTKEMALAYADAIDSQKSIVENNSGTQFDLYAALLDLSDDGMPILVTMIGERPGGSMFYMDGMPAIFVWIWNGKKAEQYTFKNDLRLNDLNDIKFIASPGNGAVVVIEGASLADASSFGRIQYKVSNARLSREITETLHIANVSIEDSDYALCKEFPGVGSKIYDDEMRYAKMSDLLDAGWIIDDYNTQVGRTPVYMLEVNGKLKPFGNIDNFNSWWADYDKYSGKAINLTVYSSAEHSISDNAMDSGYAVSDNLKKYAESAGKPVYSYNEIKDTLTDSEVKKIAKKIAGKYKGEVGEIYKLSDDLYYVIIYIDGKVSGTAIVKNTKNGKDWRIVKSYDKPADEEALSKEVNKDLQTPNVNIDFNKVDEGVKYIEEVLKNIDGSTINPSAGEEITKFIDASISRCSAGKAEAKNNVIVIPGNKIKKVSDNADKMYNDYLSVLKKYDITLDKPITVIVQFVIKNVDSKKPVQFKLTKDMLNSLEKADGLSIIPDGTKCSVKVTKESLKSIISQHGEISVILQDKGNGSYIIQFTDSNQKIIKKLCDTIIFTVPANNEFCTIQAEYTGGTDNWGGQYDSANKCLIFGASYSGTYTVLDKKTEIDDIEKLTDEEQKAIRFLVSKGILELDGKNFNPDANLTRYDFSKALVKMCFEADYDAKADFSDMKEDNPYYPYVASGVSKHIIEGYEDGTFRGENNALREEVIALCSRTLKEEKGYTEPENPEDYLHFTDNDAIEWGHSEIALAVRQALIDDGGVLAPQSPTSRKDAAIILYRLFMLLHEVEPVAIGAGNSMQKDYTDLIIPVLGAIAGVASLGALITILIILKRKNGAKVISKSIGMIYPQPGVPPQSDSIPVASDENTVHKDDK